jgi:hypothetical protein
MPILNINPTIKNTLGKEAATKDNNNEKITI